MLSIEDFPTALSTLMHIKFSTFGTGVETAHKVTRNGDYAMGWTIWCSNLGKKKIYFFFSKTSTTAPGPTQSPSQWIPGTLAPGLKRPVHEAGHTPRSSAEVKAFLACTGTILPFTFTLTFT
jgi:hypothetical protein